MGLNEMRDEVAAERDEKIADLYMPDIIHSAALTAWCLEWADAVDRAREAREELEKIDSPSEVESDTFAQLKGDAAEGVELPSFAGTRLEDIAPSKIPGKFIQWARQVVRGTFDALRKLPPVEGLDVISQWTTKLDEKKTGHAIAGHAMGHGFGFYDYDLPEEDLVPSIDVPQCEPGEIADGRTPDPPITAELLIRTGAMSGSPDPERDAAFLEWLVNNRSAREALEWYDTAVNNHGIERIDLPAPDGENVSDGGTFDYSNAGDTYETTFGILDDEDGERLIVSDWGSVLEAAETERTERTGEVLCGHCGEWTPYETYWTRPDEDPPTGCVHCGEING